MADTPFDLIHPANAAYLEQLWERYQQDPSSVDSRWAVLFAGLEASSNGGNGAALAHGYAREFRPRGERNLGVFDLIHSYRQFGHLIANLDPLGDNPPFHPLLDPAEFDLGANDMDRVVECPTYRGCDKAKVRDLIRLLHATYCGTLGVEYMDIFDTAQRHWLQERMEPTLNRPQLSPDYRKRVLQRLTAAEGFEQFLHTKFVGQKRFSLEGGDSLIPMLDALIEDAADLGTEEIVMGMAHRGRLNVLAHILNKPYEMIFAEFEGAFLPSDVQGDGDVKYHLGYSRNVKTGSGHVVHVSLCSNPSHLEAVNPVAEGMVRAKQHYLKDEDRRKVIPILIHGDASFTGQGLVSETLSLSELDGYRTGGTIHVIINNRIGFTTAPEDYRFTRYPSDTAREIQAPVFHVNGDDPEAAVQAAKLHRLPPAVRRRRDHRSDLLPSPRPQ
ncbi:MAG TPA: thiamine pyrophosphate-dependent enzyme [Terriglobales bacterium]|nr:thiamine pyrophosphate-dependent enzyme [Terriglobales bacterium]